MEEIKVGICQMPVAVDKGENLKMADAMLQEAAAAGCQLAVLPEMFNCPYDAALFADYAEEYPHGPTIQFLARAAQAYQMFIVGGSIPERAADGRIFNTSFLFAADGTLAGRHRKIHLFDVELTEGTSFQESAVLAAGDTMTLATIGDFTIGVGICYDIRFPELARKMVLAGAELLVYPAVFGPVTGPAHWELLLKSRAVDNQVFTIGAAPAFNAAAGSPAYGHSTVIDPWGTILAKAEKESALVTAVLSRPQLQRVRRELPLLRHRRPIVYTEQK